MYNINLKQQNTFITEPQRICNLFFLKNRRWDRSFFLKKKHCIIFRNSARIMFLVFTAVGNCGKGSAKQSKSRTIRIVLFRHYLILGDHNIMIGPLWYFWILFIYLSWVIGQYHLRGKRAKTMIYFKLLQHLKT